MAVLTPRVPVLAGLQGTAYTAAAGGGDSFVADATSRYLIHVKNGHTSSQTVTIDDPSSVAPASAKTFNPDVDVVVVNAQESWIYLQSPSRFMDSSGNINLSYSGVTALTLAIYKLA